MPTKPPHPCNHPGCREVTYERFCARHAGEPTDFRASAAKRGYGRHHQRWRLLVLHRDPICAICGSELSDVADHIQRLQDGGEWSLENGQGLCRPCHSFKTQVVDCAAKGLDVPAILVLQAERFNNRRREWEPSASGKSSAGTIALSLRLNPES